MAPVSGAWPCYKVRAKTKVKVMFRNIPAGPRLSTTLGDLCRSMDLLQGRVARAWTSSRFVVTCDVKQALSEENRRYLRFGPALLTMPTRVQLDRKSTRLNSSH